jgi:hypothetical protein
MYLSIIFSSVPLLASFNKLIIGVMNTEVYKHLYTISYLCKSATDSLAPSSLASLLLYSELYINTMTEIVNNFAVDIYVNMSKVSTKFLNQYFVILSTTE